MPEQAWEASGTAPCCRVEDAGVSQTRASPGRRLPQGMWRGRAAPAGGAGGLCAGPARPCSFSPLLHDWPCSFLLKLF